MVSRGTLVGFLASLALFSCEAHRSAPVPPKTNSPTRTMTVSRRCSMAAPPSARLEHIDIYSLWTLARRNLGDGWLIHGTLLPRTCNANDLEPRWLTGMGARWGERRSWKSPPFVTRSISVPGLWASCSHLVKKEVNLVACAHDGAVICA